MEEYTKYEKARIIGARALQLSMGAPMMIKLETEDLEKLRYSTIEIAKMEYDKGLVPITVKRVLPEKIYMPDMPKKVAAKIDISIDGLDEVDAEKDEFDEVDSGAGDEEEV